MTTGLRSWPDERPVAGHVGLRVGRIVRKHIKESPVKKCVALEHDGFRVFVGRRHNSELPRCEDQHLAWQPVEQTREMFL